MIELSIAGRSCRTDRFQAIARVGDNLRAYYGMLQDQMGPEHSILVWEEGGYFNENAGRLARAFAWCLGRMPRM